MNEDNRNKRNEPLNQTGQMTIEEYFNQLLEKNKNIDDDALDILRKLINLTLSYRDKFEAETGAILTVADTRRAIDVYMEALQTEFLPGNLNPRVNALVRLGALDVDFADSVLSAYEELITLVLDHQLIQRRRGETPDKLINPKEMTPHLREVLRDSIQSCAKRASSR